MPKLLQNFIGGRWTPATATAHVDVFNPATGAVIARTPLSNAQDVDRAVRAAADPCPAWSETPSVVRACTMFAFKAQLEAHFEELARLVTTEHGKTLAESPRSGRPGLECGGVAAAGRGS